MESRDILWKLTLPTCSLLVAPEENRNHRWRELPPPALRPLQSRQISQTTIFLSSWPRLATTSFASSLRCDTTALRRRKRFSIFHFSFLICHRRRSSLFEKKTNDVSTASHRLDGLEIHCEILI